MMVWRRLLLIVAALLVLAAIVAWTCPADLVYRRVADTFGPLRLRGIDGTVWHGRAENAQFLGQDLGAFAWTLQPWPLLHGDVVAHVDLAGTAVAASGSVNRHGDEITIADATLRLPAHLAAPALAIPALDLEGTIEIAIAQATLRNLLVQSAAGSATWHDAAVAGAAQARLGDLQATFSADGAGGVAGEVGDRGGPLAVAGRFTANLVRYHARVRLAVRGDNPQLTEALQYVGQPQADGSRDLEIEGRQLALPVPQAQDAGDP